MTSWFAVYTQPRKERLAAEHLARQGFATFCPEYLKRRSHARKVETVAAPLFPRYLFVSFDPATARWRAIRSTRGVVDLVCNGNDPVVVPGAVVEEIKSRSGEDGFVALAKQTKIARGARIRVDAGAFSGCEAIFEAQHDNDRVTALLSLLGRQVLVNVPIQAIVPADLP